MHVVIQSFQNELTREERTRFEALALQAGHSPGQFLKAVLLAPAGQSAAPQGRGLQHAAAQSRLTARSLARQGVPQRAEN